MKLKNIIKKCAKKILNDDVKIINTKINYENFSKAMKDLIKRNKALLSSEDHFGKRPDNKDFYPVVKKIENGFNLLFKELNEYDEDGYIPPLEAQTVSSGNPIKSKPFPMCEEFILKTLLKRSLYQYPSITGKVKCKAHGVNYLIREGFREKPCKGYDGIGVENVVFTCSTTQGFQFVLETILRDEDVILVTGPNYGLFAIAPERINARVEVLNLCEEDNFFVNPKKLANKIDDEEGLGIIDMEVKHLDRRISGDVVMSHPEFGELVGFINKSFTISMHQKGTFEYIFKDEGLVSEKDSEGYQKNNLLATQLIGPLLVKNPAILNYYVKTLCKKVKDIDYIYERKSYAVTLEALKQRIK